ncbi:streptophobe family protein [Streptomyces sp. NPDC003077]|uniref:streptophobe family protein n=1 Tax=Streptomyces sp. NPDC003077 TaxID=3154443 RepID=UPI0033A12479
MAAGGTARIRWGDVVLSSVAAVSWAFLAMTGVAALGLYLLGADATGALGPLTAAAVVLAVGGTVTPSGDVHAFGLTGQAAESAVDIMPLGVSLVGALLLGWIFVRSLRRLGATVSWAELGARAGVLTAFFLTVLAGLSWAGHDSITIDGKSLAGLVGGGGGGGNGDEGGGGLIDQLTKGLGDLTGLGGDDDGGGLPGRIADLIGAKAAVGFDVHTGASLGGGVLWVLGVLLVALLATRRTPLPRALDAAHRWVRPAASALVLVLVLAVVAGLAAAVYAAIGDDHPRRVLGAALLGAPNGAWLAIPLGLFVPWHGTASGALTQLLPDPVDRLLDGQENALLTVPRLAELDGRVWLLVVAAALMMLLAGAVAAVRTPRPARLKALPFAVRCALPLAVLTALTLPLLVGLTGVSANAGLSVFGFDAFGARVALRGDVPLAFVIGAAWGAGAGLVGALLACATGAAGRQAVRPMGAEGVPWDGAPSGGPPSAGAPEPSGGAGSAGWAPEGDAPTRRLRRTPGNGAEGSAGGRGRWSGRPRAGGDEPGADHGEPEWGTGRPGPGGTGRGPTESAQGPPDRETGRPASGPGTGQERPGPGGARPSADGRPSHADVPHEPGPYHPAPVFRPPRPETNPYLRPLPPDAPPQQPPTGRGDQPPASGPSHASGQPPSHQGGPSDPHFSPTVRGAPPPPPKRSRPSAPPKPPRPPGPPQTPRTGGPGQGHKGDPDRHRDEPDRREGGAPDDPPPGPG